VSTFGAARFLARPPLRICVTLLLYSEHSAVYIVRSFGVEIGFLMLAAADHFSFALNMERGKGNRTRHTVSETMCTAEAVRMVEGIARLGFLILASFLLRIQCICGLFGIFTVV
jgi:hypothetical protein